jgi:tRNA-2-methylthio-N6-dimethylallyladenosine synthase
MTKSKDAKAGSLKKGMKTLSILLRTFGCQMNVRDSEVICGLLRTAKYKLTVEPEKADVIIFNTCSVRQHAEDKVWSEIGRYGKAKRQGRSQLPAGTAPVNKPVIGLVGCMAQNYQEKVFDRAPQVDFVVGPSDIHQIPTIISKFFESKEEYAKSRDSLYLSSKFFERKIWETDGDIRPEEIYHTGYHDDNGHAYVVVSEGCSNHCSYCVVPHVRGELRNRSHKDILKEIEETVSNGITKFTLLGQNVNAYECEGINFVKLVKLVNAVKGLREFGFITSHPKDTTLELFQAMAECEKLKKYLHLPVQAGSDRILELMNRGYNRKFYLDLIKSYRKIVNNGVLTTDIIVGYPTETEEDFQDTYDLVRDAQFNAAFMFKYSPRPHTEAEKLADCVERNEKERRHGLILELQKSISRKK